MGLIRITKILKCKNITVPLALAVLLFINEFLLYYFVLFWCSWPSITITNKSVVSNSFIKVMVLADTHLLGSREGHWFDKLRREWQMERSFQTAITLLNPQIVIVLGDLFDEGKWCSDSEFYYHVDRFQKMFRHPANTKLLAVAGNHDIGFHYMMNANKIKRFQEAFNTSSVRKVHVQNNIFIAINSMAMEKDECSLCKNAEMELKKISQSLKCAKGELRKDLCVNVDAAYNYSRPILLQHFPMYRESDINCTGPDAAPYNEKKRKMKEKWDVLSESSSKMILDRLQPRLILGGHTHHFCYHLNADGTPEWSVPSFSWRNRNNPSFLLMLISNEDFFVSQCFLPEESTVINSYIIGSCFIFLCIIVCNILPLIKIKMHAS